MDSIAFTSRQKRKELFQVNPIFYITILRQEVTVNNFGLSKAISPCAVISNTSFLVYSMLNLICFIIKKSQTFVLAKPS